MPVYKSVRAAVEAIKRDTVKLEKALRRAVKTTARSAASEVRSHIPVAFKQLVNSLHIEDLEAGHSRVVADAPHAAAVEFGSRPHTPPLGPLIAWVKLRGMQGLSKGGRVKRASTRGIKTTSQRRGSRQAREVATQLSLMVVRGRKGHGFRLPTGKHSEIDAPVRIARAIQHAISINGTKPTWYMGRSVPFAEKQLRIFVDRELAKAARNSANEG